MGKYTFRIKILIKSDIWLYGKSSKISNTSCLLKSLGQTAQTQIRLLRNCLIQVFSVCWLLRVSNSLNPGQDRQKSFLIWAQTDCKVYQQKTSRCKQAKRVWHFIQIVSWQNEWNAKVFLRNKAVANCQLHFLVVHNNKHSKGFLPLKNLFVTCFID